MITNRTRSSRLSLSQRSWLDLVRRAISANPFTQARPELDLRIAGDAAVIDHDLPIGRALERVRAEVDALEKTGGATRARFSGEDRDRVDALLEFHLYHEYRDAFDDHIARQMERGAKPAPVAFAAECLGRLRRAGFEPEEALRVFATFFQLRRAFYFIHRALLGRSACMQALRAELWNNVFTCDVFLYERHLWNRMEDFSLLLLGETGTGKGAAAAAIGRSGYIPFVPETGAFAQSFTALFLPVNLSQYAATLIESELFGHRKGAFTGAVQDHEGMLDRCPPNGAIFLDEIGELSAPVQIKLLRVLQERVFSPVGGHEEHRFSGRVIAATNRSLEALRRDGGFRDDFFYRLCSDQVEVPPLRQRLREDPGELDELLRHIVGRLCGNPDDALAEQVKHGILDGVGPDYAWPGNVRELEQAARRVLLKGTYDIRAAASSRGDAAEMARLFESGDLDARSLLARYCRLLHDRHGNYGEVARRTGLDRRTVRKYILTDGAD